MTNIARKSFQGEIAPKMDNYDDKVTLTNKPSSNSYPLLKSFDARTIED